ncbi:MAG: ATP-binding protein [Snowella sp.]|nr:ATP-binding protein [Snowella sp.]
MSLQDLIDQLLFEEEGNTLDFKCEQYRFRGATEDEKAELLKDVLAFANAHRRTDAYILIGVKEVKGGRSEVVGISDDLDDANLQQFINSKTQKPIDFSYKATQYNGCKIGIIRIPVQRRPFYLVKDFGKLQKNQVYIRRSSSTDVASPEEILSSMGKEELNNYREIPSLNVFLVSGQHDEIKAKKIDCQLIIAKLSDDKIIPDYGVSRGKNPNEWLELQVNTGINKNYYRQWIEYYFKKLRIATLKIGVDNLSSIPAKDVKVVLEIKKQEKIIEIYDFYKLPEKPNKNEFQFTPRFSQKGKEDIVIKEIPQGWKISCYLGKIQPKDLVNTMNSFYISSFSPSTIQLSTQIFSDDLPEPKQEILEIDFKTEDRLYSIDDLLSNANLDI